MNGTFITLTFCLALASCYNQEELILLSTQQRTCVWLDNHISSRSINHTFPLKLHHKIKNKNSTKYFSLKSQESNPIIIYSKNHSLWINQHAFFFSSEEDSASLSPLWIGLNFPSAEPHRRRQGKSFSCKVHDRRLSESAKNRTQSASHRFPPPPTINQRRRHPSTGNR